LELKRGYEAKLIVLQGINVLESLQAQPQGGDEIL